MANAPNTSSTLSLPNGVNKTSTALSTNIVILVNNTPVGAIQRLSINENRSIKMISEVGTDGHIDSTPEKSTSLSGTCDRVRFDGLRVAEAFSRGFLHVHSQVYPFDIMIIDKQKRDSASQIITVLKNVWIKTIDYEYGADNWVISDKMTFEFERIYSHLTGGQSAATGGERGIKHIGGGVNGVVNIISSNDSAGNPVTNIEQLSDIGFSSRGGSMDAGGLIDIGVDTALF